MLVWELFGDDTGFGGVANRGISNVQTEVSVTS